MDSLAKKVRQVAESYVRPAINAELVPAFDDDHQTYVVLAIADLNGKHYHHVVLHLRVVGDHVIVEDHNTDADIVADLVAAGIPQEAIEYRTPIKLVSEPR